MQSKHGSMPREKRLEAASAPLIHEYYGKSRIRNIHETPFVVAKAETDVFSAYAHAA
jgi:hypothetical protein